MKQERIYPKFTVSAKAERALNGGHPWVYGTEVLREEPCENGALVDVVSLKGRYLGTGFVSEKSKIRVRVFSRNANDRFDEAFWRRRLTHAWEYRKSVLQPHELECCRVIFGEADLFPGLTVDRFGSILSAQVLSVGMEQCKELLFPLLVDVLQQDGQRIDGIYERNDVAIRGLEGMAQYKGWYDLSAHGLPTPKSALAEIEENGVRYTVDVENGQKTGFFLDQKYNRAAVARLAQGKRVLDCFTHTGSFALNAAKGGAAHVTAVDVSETAVEMARLNAERNGVSDRMDCVAADVFELLPTLEQGAYDFIILDPPAFTKSRKTLHNALRGYKEINYRAMKLLPRGGYLATCSCSHFATEEEFCKMLVSAAKDANVQLRQIEARQQSPDHPILWGVPETSYLKFYLFQVV
ncbi:MAG TPA: class I SAM-dependent rRNA methyltransferase [Candidatus Ruthenibacterium avium]|uniref:Class I SAM-dependent rRNA methyltransferase n=1 Tax=Candidatus Ruthenibacterium avium TaxID=2838751 RepID=A0A9D2M265_9FIRM|nr:class I SAM-dependent rRNA methyltransferase [Candidatus Ruthenibacterium avium]